jgi:hypothetical protein
MNRLLLLTLGVIGLATCSRPPEAPPAPSATSASSSGLEAAAPDTPLRTFALVHYRFWHATPTAGNARIPTVVDLLGKFDSVKWKARVLDPEYIANPVEKTHGRVTASYKPDDVHLVMYGLRLEQPDDPPAPPTTFINQFESKPVTWHLSAPYKLLVPADKKLRGEPTDPRRGDHYVCYSVSNDTNIRTTLTLSDQFQVWIKKISGDENVRHLTPAYFCVPANKTRTGYAERPLINNTDCMAIYRIAPPAELKKPLIAKTADQFGSFTFDVHNADMLGVPSDKLSPHP